jgi:ABC-2 type transport system permease protein
MSAVATPLAAAGPSSRQRPSFLGAVRAELLKIRSQRLTWALLGPALLGTLALPVLVGTSEQARQNLAAHPELVYFQYLSAAGGYFDTASGIFLLLVGAWLVGMEYGSGTIRVVLGRGTGRLQLLAAQYAALAVCGLLLLAGFAAVAAVGLYAVMIAWHGSFSPIASLPAVAWRDTWLAVLAALASMAVCILLAAAAGAVGRSLAVAVGLAVAFFPTDNFGVVVMGLLERVTNQDLWPQLTQWFLGPTLNQLPAALQTDHDVGSAFAQPLVPVDATHAWVVIGAYALALAAVAVLLTWRRDVLE